MSHVSYAPVARSAGNPLFDLATALGQRTREVQARRSLKKLFDHEDYMLEDMGVARTDLDWVLSLPLSVDAKAELQRLGEMRHKARI